MNNYAVVNPANDETILKYPHATDKQIHETLDLAQQTYLQWSNTTTVAERASLIQNVAHLFSERKEELGRIITREMGKPIGQAIAEASFSSAITATFAEKAEEWLADEVLNVKDGRTTFVRHQGIGPLLGIMPWNFPYYQVVRFAVPNILLGNTVVLKHAEQCPESALMIEDIFRQAGIPHGAYQNIFATHQQVSTMIADDRIQGVSLTGSERAGSEVAQQAGQALKKCVLELGGSDAYLVLDTDDIDHAVDQAVNSRMANSGQACNGSKRIIVMHEYYDEFKEKFVAKMSEQQYGRDFGPISSTKATATLTEQVQSAINQGAEILIGDNQPAGNKYAPVVLSNIDPAMEVSIQELFGPVAQLYRVENEEEAINLANAVPYGLGAILICDDHERAERVANQLEVGMIYIGSAGLEGPDVPFGGTKRSGYGRELGKTGMLEFANRKLFRYA